MVYAKAQLNDGVEIMIDIEDNLFTRCPICGKEKPVDIYDYQPEHLPTILDPCTMTYCSDECRDEDLRRHPELDPETPHHTPYHDAYQ